METNGTKVGSLSGRGVVHRHLDKRQLACIGANVADGLTNLELSIAQLTAALKVSRGYIDLARTLSPEKRQAIIEGRDQTSFVGLLKAPQQLALPSTNGRSDDLVAVVRKYGAERVFDACFAAAE
jgi:hypothetical protein